MRKRLRLLPLTMLMAFLLLGLKVGEVMHDGRMLLLSFAQAQAQEESKEPAKPAADAASRAVASAACVLRSANATVMTSPCSSVLPVQFPY